MLTASQARGLSAESGLQVERILSLLDASIKETATGGRRSYSAYKEVPWQSEELYTPVTISPIQAKIIARLKLLGFTAEMRTDNAYVPVGLADDKGNGPLYSNRVLKIGW